MITRRELALRSRVARRVMQGKSVVYNAEIVCRGGAGLHVGNGGRIVNVDILPAGDSELYVTDCSFYPIGMGA